MDFAILERAGISQRQFAELVGTNRVTVNTWVKGHFSPGPKFRHRVAVALRLIKRAVETRRLPLPAVPQNERLLKVLGDLSKAIDAEA